MLSEIRKRGCHGHWSERLPFVLLLLTVVAITTVLLQRLALRRNHAGRTRFDTGDSCRAFLDDSGGEMEGNTWKPSTCRMHYYTKPDIETCMNRSRQVFGKRSHFVFIGDSRMREQFHVFAQTASSKPYFDLTQKLFRRSRYYFADYQSDMEMVWNTHLRRFAQTKDWLTRKKPSFIVINVGLWHMLENGPDYQTGLKQFKASLKAMASTLHQLGKITTVIWMMQAPVIRQYIVNDDCAGREHFVRERNKMRNVTDCGHEWRRNEWNRGYNKATSDILSRASPSTFLWTTGQRVVDQFWFDQLDGIHLLSYFLPDSYIKSNISGALRLRAQMLLNVHCNRFRADDKLADYRTGASSI